MTGRSFAHGVHPPQSKAQTREKATRRLPFAPRLAVPLSQHLGKPAVPMVKAGQEVVRGEPIARADGFMSVPVHAPATGVVKGVQLVASARGPKTEAILIQVYPGESQEVLYDCPRDLETMTREELVQAVQDTGMVGLGGAAFPPM